MTTFPTPASWKDCFYDAETLVLDYDGYLYPEEDYHQFHRPDPSGKVDWDRNRIYGEDYEEPQPTTIGVIRTKDRVDYLYAADYDRPDAVPVLCRVNGQVLDYDTYQKMSATVLSQEEHDHRVDSMFTDFTPNAAYYREEPHVSVPPQPASYSQPGRSVPPKRSGQTKTTRRAAGSSPQKVIVRIFMVLFLVVVVANLALRVGIHHLSQSFGNMIPEIQVEDNDWWSDEDDGEETAAAWEEEPFYGVWCGPFDDTDDAYDLYFTLSDEGFYPLLYECGEWEGLDGEEDAIIISAGYYSTQEEAEEDLENVQAIYPDAYVRYTGAYSSS